MASSDSESLDFTDERHGAQDDLRRRISTLLVARADLISSDTVSVFPFSGAESLDANYCRRVGHLLVQLLAFGVREGRLDTSGAFVSDLYRVALERGVTIEQIFTFAYLLERTVMDELALDESIGATTEPWPVVAQMVRRSSFEMLAAYAERSQLEPSEAAVIDRLTTLHTRPVLDVALAKAAERASRFGELLSLILFDVDHLARINADYGYGVGDRILERLGILIRMFFRQYDWIARHSGDSIAVLLTRTDADPAAELAERVVATVQERLELTDHRSDQPVRVTVTGAIVNLAVGVGDVVDPERLMAEAEAALDRAKRAGRNRVERVDRYSNRRPT